MKKIILSFLAIFFFVHLNAQDKNLTDRIILKNGSIINGQLLDYNYGRTVKFQIENGGILSFPDSVVRKVETNYKKTMKYKSKLDEKGFYCYIGFKYLPGASEYYYKNSNGLGIDYTLGYKSNDNYAIGIGVSLENYNYGYDAFFVPVYLDFMSYSPHENVSPFIRFQSGYGFVHAPKDKATKSTGGLMLNPAFGLRFFGNYTLDFNFKYQKATFETRIDNINKRTKDIVFRRFSIRFGVIF